MDIDNLLRNEVREYFFDSDISPAEKVGEIIKKGHGYSVRPITEQRAWWMTPDIAMLFLSVAGWSLRAIGRLTGHAHSTVKRRILRARVTVEANVGVIGHDSD